MPNIKSAKKRVLVTQTKTLQNKMFRTQLKTDMKKYQAAVAAGADGLMIEVHNNPAKAKCDGAQSLTPDQFDELMGFITKEVEFFGKKMN